MIKIIPILMGVLVPYVVALCCGMIDFSSVAQADIVGLPPFQMAKFESVCHFDYGSYRHRLHDGAYRRYFGNQRYLR